MRYPLSYLPSTGRTLLCLLCGGALLASCETSPNSFTDDPVSSELPLKQITLSKISQYLVVLPQDGSQQGVALNVESPQEDLVVPLREGEGKLTKGEEGVVINFHLASIVPVDPSFEIEYKVGYSLDSFLMDLQIRPADANETPHLTQNQCVTDHAMLTVTKVYPPWDRHSFSYPIDATIDSLSEIKNDKGESVYTGRIHLYVFSGTEGRGPGNRDDIFIYTLEANILIE